jgi:L-ascorbate metabolism protein UlaG (beta-lactamase superfamily)
MRLGGLRLERAVASKQYRDGSFHNTSVANPGLEGPRVKIIREFLFGGGKRKPPGVIPVESPLETWTKPVDDLRVTWLGHSSMLLELDGVRVLTDPVFGNRLGPVSFMGPKRFHAPPVTVEQLPPLDAVLVSHDHFDHLCKPTIEQIAKLDVPVITSLGVGAHLEAFGVLPERIVELDWWEQHALPGGRLQFTATPAQHFSGRIGGRNSTLWSSWVIETANKKVFFSGDTGLTQEFVDIRATHGPFDLVMLEIGAWHPAWGTIHLGPENALKAFELLGGGTMMPVHWATFDLGLHPWAEPAETLWTLAEANRQRIVTPRLGVPFEPAHVDKPVPWWREVLAEVPNEISLSPA